MKTQKTTKELNREQSSDALNSQLNGGSKK